MVFVSVQSLSCSSLRGSTINSFPIRKVIIAFLFVFVASNRFLAFICPVTLEYCWFCLKAFPNKLIRDFKKRVRDLTLTVT